MQGNFCFTLFCNSIDNHQSSQKVSICNKSPAQYIFNEKKILYGKKYNHELYIHVLFLETGLAILKM